MTRRREAVEIRLGLDSARQQLHEVVPAARDPRSDGLSAVFSLAGRGAIFIGIGLFFVQQFVGINAVIYYSSANLPRIGRHDGRNSVWPARPAYCLRWSM